MDKSIKQLCSIYVQLDNKLGKLNDLLDADFYPHLRLIYVILDLIGFPEEEKNVREYLLINRLSQEKFKTGIELYKLVLKEKEEAILFLKNDK